MQNKGPVGGPAVVLASKALHTINAKTAHGLLRYSSRFQIQAVVDADHVGEAASHFLAGTPSAIPIVRSVQKALELGEAKYALVGVATHGGVLPDPLREDILASLAAGLTLINGLHRFLGEETLFAEAAEKGGAEILDIRKPKPRNELHFWSGRIFEAKAPRLAVLGMDCAIGKRTTARILVEACRHSGLRTEMIYTGQTGWMQGGDYGFILDSVPNDFVSGELEYAICSCDADLSPQLIVLEGQSSLQNLSGPCGAELLLSAQAKGVVLQHAPGRKYLEGYEKQGFSYPNLKTEAELIRLYGSRLLAITVNPQHLTEQESRKVRQQLQSDMGVPTLDPFTDAEKLVSICREYVNEN
ncbi:MAG: DUF1611 domain-containing protein [Bdellovibrionales bacterium]|nr:DUF1611 domain-containing protein [Bdellovibrionales bacterium]